jgi:SnoaL-like domain
MTEHSEAGEILTEMWARIDARQWDRLAELLDPDVQVRYVHTGELLDFNGILRANSDYPGRWRANVEELVSVGPRAVSRTRLDDGESTFHVATFATTARGRITAMTEVWTDTGQPAHPSRLQP